MSFILAAMPSDNACYEKGGKWHSNALRVGQSMSTEFGAFSDLSCKKLEEVNDANSLE